MAGTPITPASPAVFPSSITVPVDGDLANAASVVTPMQDMLTGLDAARAAHYGVKRHRRVVSTNLADLVIGPLGYVMVTSGGVWRVLQYTTSSTISAATKLGGALADTTRYYVYAGIVAGVADFIVSTDPPDAMRAYRSGNTDHLYITTFLTDTAGHIIPFRHDSMLYRYYPAFWGVSGTPAAALAVVNVGAATDGSPVTVTGFGSATPSYVTHAIVECSVVQQAGGTSCYTVIGLNVSSPYDAGVLGRTLTCFTNRTVSMEFDIMLAAAGGTWTYQRTAADLTAIVMGWYE